MFKKMMNFLIVGHFFLKKLRIYFLEQVGLYPSLIYAQSRNPFFLLLYANFYNMNAEEITFYQIIQSLSISIKY